MRTCSLLIASPNAGFLPRIAHRIKLPTSVWHSIAPHASSGANARASDIWATGLPVHGIVIVLQVSTSRMTRPLINLTRVRWSWVGTNFRRPRPLFSLISNPLIAKIRISGPVKYFRLDLQPGSLRRVLQECRGRRPFAKNDWHSQLLL